METERTSRTTTPRKAPETLAGSGVEGAVTNAPSVGAIVGELHVDAEIGLAQQLDDLLEGVAVAAGDAHEIALDGGLHPELAVLDLLHDLAGFFGGDALLQRDFLAHGGPGGGNDLSVGQSLERHLAPNQLGFEKVHHRFELEF